ncbi:U4/U6.U5 small nuclear ribonucleoprotein 27kDa protein domain-containing protein [Plasmodiophora brassicae]
MVDARRRGFRGSQNATLSEQLRDVAAADAIAVAFPGRAAAKRPVTFAASAAAQSRQASKPEVDQPGAPAPSVALQVGFARAPTECFPGTAPQEGCPSIAVQIIFSRAPAE